MDKIHSNVNQDINKINALNQPHNIYNIPHTYSQNLNNIDQNIREDNLFDKNKSVIDNHSFQQKNNIYKDFDINDNYKINRGLTTNKTIAFYNNEIINHNQNKNSKNIFVNDNISKNNINTANNINTENNQNINYKRNNKNDNINTSSYSRPQSSLSESNNEKLVKDFQIMDKLVEKYKIVYFDSFYFKRDKNYNQAIERNLHGQEYVDKLLNILYGKQEKEYDKYINIVKNLQKQFATLMQEIQTDIENQGKNSNEMIKQIKENINIKNTNSNTNSNNNQNDKFAGQGPNLINRSVVPQQSNFINQAQKENKSNVPADILEKIKSEILDKNPKVKFEEVVGLDNVKQALKEIIIIPSLRPDLFTGLRSPAKGLLLFGPPGTGKTLIAKAVATECKSTFFNISASSLTSKYVGESEKLVKALFEVAHYPENQPAIIFIDEIESILSKRNESENEASKRLKTEFLIQFDGVATNTNDRVLVVGATNRPQDLDPAVLRRLPKKIYVGPMDFNGRANFIFQILKNTKTDNNLKDNDFNTIARLSDNYSNSDLKELCRQACIEPIRELKEGQLETIDKLRPICLNDFTKAVNVVRGTLTPEMLNEYIIWNKENGALN